MKNKKRVKVFFVLIMLIGLILNSCGSREETVSCFPNNIINVVIDTNMPRYASELTNGWAYVNEQGAGSRGLILVRTGVAPHYQFKAYDRNAPHLCPDAETTLEVQSNTKIVSPKDGAEWLLITGQPSKIAPLPPKSYPVSYNANTGILIITSY